MAFFPSGSFPEDQIKSFRLIPVKCAMAESSTYLGVSGTEMTALKEVLHAQQQLLQKLYLELDEEREASATAASEALSMILRLQGEKAAMKMETDQYKRMTEERICHAEESRAAFEELMYQKEMEIAYLEFQIQAYRCKLLSMGCSDLVDGETRFPENFLLQTNDAFLGDMGVSGIITGHSSATPVRLKDSCYNAIERERSAGPVADSISKIMEENCDDEFNAQGLGTKKKLENSVVGNPNSYWVQIMKLDEQVKEILDCKNSKSGDKSKAFKVGLGSSSLLSQVGTCTLFNPTGDITAKTDQVKHSENFPESEEFVDCPSSPSAHDIFDVPQIHQNLKQPQKKEHSKLIVEGENRLGKPDFIVQKAVEFNLNNETDCVKKTYLRANHENKLSKPSDGIGVDCHFGLVHPAIGVAEFQAEFQQLSRMMKQLEDDGKAMRQEARYGGEGEVKLLREIHEQLNSIQSEIRNWRPKKSLPSDESPLLSVMEAMLHFWL